jgi:hypothetical protein
MPIELIVGRTIDLSQKVHDRQNGLMTVFEVIFGGYHE